MNHIDFKDKNRQILTAKISEEAANGWRDFCEMHGISVSALLEAAGEAAGRDIAGPPGLARQRTCSRMIEVAR